jgi:3-hydroxybutyrate dehydrogenase
LITGSTSGIGLGIAEKFAKEGKDLIINGFGPQDSINQIISNLKKLGNLNPV